MPKMEAASIRDRVAIVGVGSTPHLRDSGTTGVTRALRASRSAIRDAGLTAADIDGVVGSLPVQARDVVSGLDLPTVHWWANTSVPFTFQIIEAMNAVHAGAATAVLAYHAPTRAPGTSRSAAKDPVRARSGPGANRPAHTPDTIAGAVAYAAWASRYFSEFGARREDLGLVAINNRSNAASNPHAALSEPLTMEQYLSARMIRDPLNILDMDYPVDAADAVVITSADRAADMPHRPVLIHAATGGMTAHPDEDQLAGFADGGQNIVMQRLWTRSEVRLDDIDLVLPYDGFTILNLRWLEVIGYCGNGEAGAFLEDNWNREQNRVLIGGRVPMNTHGGSLSAGGTQGAGHIREAVLQLRGEEGTRQVAGATTALVTPGGFFHNAGGLIVRTSA